MKKAIIISIAAVLVVTSLVSGVFAMYKTEIDDVSTGTTVAKEFVLTSNQTESFAENAKIAPTETLTAAFNVKNFDETKVTETGMKVTVTVTLTSDIAPLTLTMYTEKDGVARQEVIVRPGESKDIVFNFAAGVQETQLIHIELDWESTNNDNAFIGKTASYNVKVVGEQTVNVK